MGLRLSFVMRLSQQTFMRYEKARRVCQGKYGVVVSRKGWSLNIFPNFM